MRARRLIPEVWEAVGYFQPGRDAGYYEYYARPTWNRTGRPDHARIRGEYAHVLSRVPRSLVTRSVQR